MEIKNKIYFQNIIAIKKKGKVDHFEVLPRTLIDIAIAEVILFLQISNLDGEYILKFNNVKLFLSQDSDIAAKIDEYYEFYNNDVKRL